MTIMRIDDSDTLSDTGNLTPSTGPVIEINISAVGWPDEDKLLQLTRSAISSAVKAAGLKYPANAVLSLLFSDDAGITDLNAQFRNIHQPTNVLSFPGIGVIAGDGAETILGDLAFALQTIEREAILEKLDFNHHLCHLIIHGFLHLFGYDHVSDEDAVIMETFETRALALLGIKDPYFEQ